MLSPGNYSQTDSNITWEEQEYLLEGCGITLTWEDPLDQLGICHLARPHPLPSQELNFNIDTPLSLDRVLENCSDLTEGNIDLIEIDN